MPVIDLQLTLEFTSSATLVTLREVERNLTLATGSGGKLSPRGKVGEDSAALKSLGRTLARSALPKAVLEAISSLLSRHRVRLWIEVLQPEFAVLPWEFLWLADYGNFLVYHPLISIIRGNPSRLLRFSRAEDLRVLIVSANPCSATYGPLEHIDTEIRSIKNALEASECARFEVSELRHARREALLADLTGVRPPHVIHFVGHGAVQGALVLEAEKGRHELVFGDDLMSALAKAGTQLIFLSSCFGSIAIPALGKSLSSVSLVGMQGAVRDTTAHLFARATYAALADGSALDEAVRQGRSAIVGCGHEVGLPVLIAARDTGAVEDPGPFSDRLNYPPDARPFIGRLRQRHLLWRKLSAPEVRLVTISGFGGMGKTRLAKQVGEDLQFDFRDGVRLVECDVLQGRDELIGAIAKAGGVPGATSLDDLCESLRRKQILFLIDCFEYHVEHVGVLDQILSQSTGVKMLATSRTRLDSEFEHWCELKELSGTRGRLSAHSERAELFIGRACQANSEFRLTLGNKKLVDEIVNLLQGVPLALLLAAGRLRHKTLEELQRDLNERLLEVLKRPSVKRDRHASIQLVIQDSFDLLSEPEKELAIQLSIFNGGFTIQDAAAVIGDEASVEEGVARLYDQSLLASTDGGQTRRFRELDTVREYMLEVAAGKDLRCMRERHARHYARIAGDLRRQLEAGSSLQISESVWLDIGNYRAAIKYAKEGDHQEILVDLAKSLCRAFLEAGILSDFHLMAEVAEDAAKATDDLSLLIELRGLQGILARRLGDYAMAERLWLERAKFAKDIEDISSEGDSYYDIADMSVANGNLSKAEEMLHVVKTLDQGRLRPLDRIGGKLIEARLHLARERRDLALEIADGVATEIQASTDISQSTMYIWFALGKVYRSVGEYHKSYRWFAKVGNVSISQNFLYFLGSALIELAESLHTGDEAESAIRIIDIARDVARLEVKSLQKRADTLSNVIHEDFRSREIACATAASRKPRQWRERVREELSLWLSG